MRRGRTRLGVRGALRLVLRLLADARNGGEVGLLGLLHLGCRA